MTVSTILDITGSNENGSIVIFKLFPLLNTGITFPIFNLYGNIPEVCILTLYIFHFKF